MRLRNKKTGEIGIARFCAEWEQDDDHELSFHIQGINEIYTYASLAELNKEWEDYEPKEPIFKDEKIQKAIRAWLNIQENPIKQISILNYGKDPDGFYGYRFFGYVQEGNINLTAISMEFRSKKRYEFKEHHDYYIEELCGENEA